MFPLRPRVRFPASSAFFTDLRARVDDYFDSRKLARTGNAAMVLKSAFWLALAGAFYAVSIAEVIAFPWSLFVAAANGVALACIGFNVGHDAIHGCYSERPWVNRVLSWSFDLMGASSATWSIFHNVVHHTYTNICGVDQDLEPGPTLRFYPRPQPPAPWQRYQFLYAWLLYGLIGFIWVFVKDFRQIRQPHPLTGERASAGVVAGLVIGKLAHLSLFLGVPLLVMDRAAWQVIVGYAAMMFAAGITLAIVFQLAHVVEGVTFCSLPLDGLMTRAWAEHELATTADFGRSRLATFVTGGLDHQVEHHLFPRVCHIHYPALAPIVARCAADHGLAYRHSGSFFAAVASHARVLRRLGRDEISPDVVVERRRDRAARPPRPRGAARRRRPVAT